MVVADDGLQFDAGRYEKVADNTLEFRLAGLEVVARQVHPVLLREFHHTGHKRVLRRPIHEGALER